MNENLKTNDVWERIQKIGNERYKVASAHESMFWPSAVVAGDGKQQLYLGREVECKNMAAKFKGAFLDGAFLYMEMLNSDKNLE